MAMTVMYNAGAQLSLGQLNKNISKAGKALAKVSSGQRIVNAQDDSASFSISERMRGQIRSLLQDNQNVQNGSSMVRTAERGIAQIIQNIRTLKEKAIDATNDSNTDEDRAPIQKEFNQLVSTIDDIAIGTEFNGKRLLDGTYSGELKTTTENVVTDEKVIELKRTDNAPVTLNEGDKITQDGVYMLPKDFTGELPIEAKNVKLIQEDPSTALKDVYITKREGGETNLWLENFNVTNSKDKNFIKFQGSGNTFNFTGTNSFKSNYSGTIINSAVINVGGGLTVEGGPSGDGKINFTAKSGSNLWGACIGSSSDENLSADIIVNSGTFVSNLLRGAGAVIGSGHGNSVVNNVIINGGTFIDKYNSPIQDALIGGGANVGNITIQNAIIEKNSSQTNEPAIGASGFGKIDNIYIKNSQIIYRGSGGAAIGTSGTWRPSPGTAGNIVIENCFLDIRTSTGAGIGSGQGGRVGNITIIHTDLSNVSSTSGDQVGKGVSGTCGTVDLSQADGYTPIVWQTVHSGISEPENTEWTPTEITRRTIESVTKVLKHTEELWVQHGTQANQRINLKINSMQAKDLKGTILNETDNAQLNAWSNSPEKQSELQALLDKAKDMTLDDARVTTVDNAKVAIRVVEGALEYALNEATTMGAYLQRLEATDANVTTMGENVQNSESTIRDADMAKEMSEYTRANILSQAAQAMLAQANQNSSSVLNLLN